MTRHSTILAKRPARCTWEEYAYYFEGIINRPPLATHFCLAYKQWIVYPTQAAMGKIYLFLNKMPKSSTQTLMEKKVQLLSCASQVQWSNTEQYSTDNLQSNQSSTALLKCPAQ